MLQRKLSREEIVNIEIDGRPACAERLLKKIVENSKHKVYDRINVRAAGEGVWSGTVGRVCVIV